MGTRREVALKLMRGSFASDRARARFDREVELTARLDHPNIARVFDSGLHQNLYYYALELIDGVTLDVYVEKHAELGRTVTTIEELDAKSRTREIRSARAAKVP